MDIDIYYWISEYGKVFCGYLFLMFLWPSVVFHGYLRKKSKTFRFSFCVTVPIVIMNTLVLGLGLVHGLSQWVIRLVLYGVFVFAFLKNLVAYLDRKYKRMMETEFPDVRSLKGKYRALVLVILFFIVCYRYVKRAAGFLSFDYIKKIKSCNWTKVRLGVKKRIWNFGRRVSTLFWNYGILALVIVYGMTYFSYGAFQVYSYGYGDLYTHHKWIYGLIEGNIFVDGIYPEAMHCFIYCMHTLFGIKVHSILLYLQIIHVAVFLVAAYLLLRKIFHWRYTPLFVLMLFLTLDLSNADLIHSMFRLQITLPMEFGLHVVFLGALYLVKYLEAEHTDAVSRNKILQKYFWDENLLIFTVSLAAVAMTHFHALMMAFIFAVAFAVFTTRKVFHKQYLIPLTTALFCAGMVAVTPMAGALAQGIPFSASIDWAIGVMSGHESRDYRNQEVETDESIVDAEEVREFEISEAAEDVQRLQRNEISFTATILRGVIEIYDKGYAALYGQRRGGWMLVLTVAVVLFCWMAKRKEKLKRFRGICLGYLPAIVISVVYIYVYAAPMIGWTDLIPEGRFFAPGHIMMLAVMVMPVDVVFFELMEFSRTVILRIMSLLSMGSIYGVAVITGNFRGFLFYEMSQYNAAAKVTESIINTFPQYSYTIVSPTDELYPVIQYGWHEELISFVEKCSNGEYSIPSEYVFIYVEKRPLLYGQSHFFTGLSWMGEEKYQGPFWKIYSTKYPDSGTSQSPDVIAGQVSEEESGKELPEYENAWSMYLQLENRTVLEAKAYDWCQKFAKSHPSVLNVYYEDDDFVCYYFRQDMGSPAYELNEGYLEKILQ